ncbi:hypothetical protein QZH41_012066, partial [Actinostola sp. cb2023]
MFILQVSCNCKSTCSTKRTGNSNRGCPCKGQNIECSSLCRCGTAAKPCKNKKSMQVSLVRSSFLSDKCTTTCTQQQPQGPDHPTEDEERTVENRRVKQFLDTLDEEILRKLCNRSLQRGIGSMEYIDTLLIMEDNNDDSEND